MSEEKQSIFQLNQMKATYILTYQNQNQIHNGALDQIR
jgi:hypothetical protein